MSPAHEPVKFQYATNLPPKILVLLFYSITEIFLLRLIKDFSLNGIFVKGINVQELYKV